MDELSGGIHSHSMHPRKAAPFLDRIRKTRFRDGPSTVRFGEILVMSREQTQKRGTGFLFFPQIETSSNLAS